VKEGSSTSCLHRKKLASVVATNPVFVVETKSTGSASTVSATAKLAVRVVANIMPPSAAELAAVLAVNLNDAVTIYVSVATRIRFQDSHLFYQAGSNFFFGVVEFTKLGVHRACWRGSDSVPFLY
jgi:hypothetical protein